MTNLDSLKLLQEVNLSGNQIHSLRGLSHHTYLSDIDMSDNQVLYYKCTCKHFRHSVCVHHTSVHGLHVYFYYNVSIFILDYWLAWDPSFEGTEIPQDARPKEEPFTSNLHVHKQTCFCSLMYHHIITSTCTDSSWLQAYCYHSIGYTEWSWWTIIDCRGKGGYYIVCVYVTSTFSFSTRLLLITGSHHLLRL